MMALYIHVQGLFIHGIGCSKTSVFVTFFRYRFKALSFMNINIYIVQGNLPVYIAIQDYKNILLKTTEISNIST